MTWTTRPPSIDIASLWPELADARQATVRAPGTKVGGYPDWPIETDDQR